MDMLAQNDTDYFQIILPFDFYFWFWRGFDFHTSRCSCGANREQHAATKKTVLGSRACTIAPNSSAAVSRLQWR